MLLSGNAVLPFMLALFVQLSAFASDASSPIIAFTKPPKLLDETTVNQPFTETEYAELANKYSSLKHFVGMKRKPTALGPNAVYGFNLVVQGKNISYILDRKDLTGYVLIADLNGNADLTDDTPIKFHNLRGKFVAEIKKTLTETIDGRSHRYPYEVRLTVVEPAQTATGKSLPALEVQSRTARKGVLSLDGRRIMFELRGSDGLYGDESNSIFFDLDSDGKFDSQTRYSAEEYKVKERWINIGNRSYEFSVDRFGDKLTLRPSMDKRKDRADLREGHTAPDFTFDDLEGKHHRLSDLNGKVVLLHIWAPWCAPSAAEAPGMASAYNRFRERGFEIVSLNNGDSVENLRNFSSKYRLNWLQGAASDAFVSLYRIDRYPTYFLIGPDGRIISNTLRPGNELYSRIEDLLDK